MSAYTVTQGTKRITVLATSMCDAICRAMEQLQHDLGGISAKKVGAA